MKPVEATSNVAASNVADEAIAEAVTGQQGLPKHESGEPLSGTVLVIDDDTAVLHVFRRVFGGTGIKVVTAGTAAEGLKMAAQVKPDVAILDVMLPDQSGLETFRKLHELDNKIPVVFITAGGTSDTAIEAMKLGAYDYLLKPLDIGKVRDLVTRALEIRQFMFVPVKVPKSTSKDSSELLVGRTPAMQSVYKAIGRVAPQNVTVLIRGESGTGKELVARAIYHHSPRSKGPFLAVNCAAIPESLLESELFGHEKGSFTGADSKRIGKFEQCDGGTLFMDEVGDMTPLVQSKLLRLLQEQRFERVGGNETIETDVRIITATHRNLEKMVADGEFRSDLYYRLNGFSVKIPPLRERTEDILVIIQHFLGRFSQQLGKDVQGVSPEAMELLLQYPWPGNVRELQSVLKQAILQTTGPVLVADFLPDEIRERAKRPSTGGSADSDLPTTDLDGYVDERLHAGSEDLYAESLTLMEKCLITRVLRHTSGNQSQAARILGITRGSLRNKVRALGIMIGQVVSVDDESGEKEEEE